MYLDNLIQFIYALTFWEIVAYFWPFFLIDMVRYVLLDTILVILYIPAWIKNSPRRRIARKRLFKERPLVSVIIPGKNEGKHIKKAADSLAGQTYKNLEIIVIDDGSDDETEQLCRELESDGTIAKFIRNEVRGGKASAANTALQFSCGKYILHIDADSYLEKNSIETILLPFYMDSNMGAVGGDVRVANVNDSLTSSLQSLEYLKSISAGRTVLSMLGILRIVSGAHGMFRRDILERIHGWDVGPGLDGDITLKIRKLGYRVVHEPHAICYTNVPTTPIRLAKQRYRWDRSLIRFRLRKHSDLIKPSKNFSLKNFISTADNLFFNVFLDIKWIIYIIQVIFFNAALLEFIFVINYILYMFANLLELAVATLLVKKSLRSEEKRLLLYVPLMPFYTGIYMRSIRTYAYLMEFLHRTSYSDKWNPWKVSKVAKKERL